MPQKKRFGFSRVALLFTAVLAVSCVANAQQLTWLGTLGGGTSNAYNVSSGGVVVGSAEDASGRTRAFLWTASTGMQDLGTLGGTTSLAYAVSEDGRVVVGYATDSNGQERAFLWTAQGGMQNLGTLGGTWSRALSVSPDGTFVTGSATDASGQRYPFLWTASSGMENLGSFGGESWAWGSLRMEVSWWVGLETQRDNLALFAGRHQADCRTWARSGDALASPTMSPRMATW